ncbi:transposase family protein [Streptomyces sp. NPDC057242]|uniref:helix-turn-helix domain-containing protein n=1 Tax=Streptomyces sp. NPDC057242 TaxID=3346063 RepID=UPI00363FBF95
MFVDRRLATLVHLRHGVTHDVPACWFAVDRSTITWAIGGIRPLLAERGCTISPGVRLRTPAGAVDHLGAGGQTGIIDGTGIRVRRAAAGAAPPPARPPPSPPGGTRPPPPPPAPAPAARPPDARTAAC